MNALLIIFIGVGSTQAIAIEDMPSMEVCEEAREAVIEYYRDKWSGPGPSDVVCVPYLGTET